jgi:lipid II:glycine glycyltransferase (peptidoglycan interpeptide bridge formation enzyme)
VSASALSKEALVEGRIRGWKYWEGRSGFVETAGTGSVRFYGHRLRLTGDSEQLFGRCESSVRRAVRKAERAGLTFETSSSESALQAYFALHCQTRKKHGLPPQPYSFFELIRNHLLARNQGFVGIANHGTTPVAGVVFLHFGTRAVYKFGASDHHYQELRGMNFVMWKAIERLAKNQFTELTFGRTSSNNEGLRRFKLGWGSEEYMVEYSRYDFKTGGFVQSEDRASGWHNRVFQCMPLPLLRLAGRLLYPHLV